jgi:lipopolysaccharide transport system permease protein
MSPTGIMRGLWRYREFVLNSVKRDFELRYTGSVLGIAWNVINPLAMIVVYTIIFTEVMRARLPGIDDHYAYAVYLCAGLLTWGLFVDIVNRSAGMFIDNANLLKKSNFPRVCLPSIVTLSALLNFAVVFGIFLAFLAVTGRFPGWPALAVVPLLLLEIGFGIGLGILVGTLNVFFRDIGQAVGVLLQFWFWLTPIVYPSSLLPEEFRFLLDFNPMASLMAAYQGIFVERIAPNWASLQNMLIAAAVLLAFGYLAFRRHAPELVDEL